MLRKLVAVVAASASAHAAAAAPTVEEFKQAFDAQMQKLKTQGFTERTVLFQEVRAGRPEGGFYPFLVTAIVHDYGPGYPANRYYGQTCVGRIDKLKYDARDDGFGGWIVQGRMTPPDKKCQDNPAQGASAMPLASLPGAPAAKAAPAAAKPAAKAAGGSLYAGEYACYGAGGRPMAGMGFKLKPGGAYEDVDGRRGGRYAYDAGAATISFKGGFLDGQTGRNVRQTGFQVSSTVSCEPWR